MRNISFALTTEQIRNQTKTVTRRLGWRSLKPGTLLQPVVKAQGIPKGGHVEKIGGPIRVVSVRREPLGVIQKPDVIREGFPELTSMEFIDFFCRSHKTQAVYIGRHLVRPSRRCESTDAVTRIEFEYVDGVARQEPA